LSGFGAGRDLTISARQRAKQVLIAAVRSGKSTTLWSMIAADAITAALA
jgi:hypothetical protein